MLFSTALHRITLCPSQAVSLCPCCPCPGSVRLDAAWYIHAAAVHVSYLRSWVYVGTFKGARYTFRGELSNDRSQTINEIFTSNLHTKRVWLVANTPCGARRKGQLSGHTLNETHISLDVVPI
ncbi:hypothetical protein HYDPIDRAFT_115207 [Hydnomerulius pinastri MD-312]|uniref:Uncharacterized protein n=1 Tax=Hydnomerulius pinastri MD-312 TaxID=994086 RepID=A0A0C9W5M1_9AGAM|nr:hypothetical protein HYDPIDRAFT_115207 [Hydnomerulius pinastri MD-312]